MLAHHQDVPTKGSTRAAQKPAAGHGPGTPRVVVVVPPVELRPVGTTVGPVWVPLPERVAEHVKAQLLLGAGAAPARLVFEAVSSVTFFALRVDQ